MKYDLFNEFNTQWYYSPLYYFGKQYILLLQLFTKKSLWFAKDEIRGAPFKTSSQMAWLTLNSSGPQLQRQTPNG